MLKNIKPTTKTINLSFISNFIRKGKVIEFIQPNGAIDRFYLGSEKEATEVCNFLMEFVG